MNATGAAVATLRGMSGAVDPDDLRRIETELGTLLRRTRGYVQEAAQHVHPELGSAAYAMLSRVVEGGPARASELVEAFGIDKAAISRQTAQLEELGLVVRAPDPVDRRAQVISATAEGRRRCLSARRRSQSALRDELGRWEPDDVRDLGLLLAKLNTISLGRKG
ncbi:MarR family transcriptional regulator [Angustibacter peucedani]